MPQLTSTCNICSIFLRTQHKIQMKLFPNNNNIISFDSTSNVMNLSTLVSNYGWHVMICNDIVNSSSITTAKCKQYTWQNKNILLMKYNMTNYFILPIISHSMSLETLKHLSIFWNPSSTDLDLENLFE